ncbi:MAG: phosphocholine cytidylyltransferase family protein [Candidatus Nanopelagicales bacterium]|nr:phosphocholine cytidylyltransferase family protein [Candidatus Nanopelagicales bacterium]MDZ4250649.1 phosphocholine cytidylyltransferase family protein [Candidatus Nanopelagicales bacterium]
MAGQAVILAAGMGTRLGRPFPKPLTPLEDGRSIMQQQIENLGSALPDHQIVIVVGFKCELIMERFPDVLYVYNEMFDQTNTSKSLLKALRVSGSAGVLWMNGDVVFDPRILTRIDPLMRDDRSFVCVNTATVGEEEVKYSVDEAGFVLELSKTVASPLGEAVGINFVAAHDKDLLITHLADVEDQDYFERGIEVAIEKEDLRVLPVDITDLFAVEVDFEADLERANRSIR